MQKFENEKLASNNLDGFYILLKIYKILIYHFIFQSSFPNAQFLNGSFTSESEHRV
ncbi:hypothetical protein LMANV2_230060 [Leptospira interrogans serovar Manilae]|uniref:Uncharacterized protein n=1 Tax=Leptospira interrogans serovar Manilae TaxID=214675 RepID=A0AAQ1NX10_LEPIR|nr:hypothetical protein LMANV2_230060 [Leptospira interrogans serovar Manilae]